MRMLSRERAYAFNFSDAPGVSEFKVVVCPAQSLLYFKGHSLTKEEK